MGKTTNATIACSVLTCSLAAQIPAHATLLNPSTQFQEPRFVALPSDVLLCFGMDYPSIGRSRDGGRTWDSIDQPLMPRLYDVATDGNRVVAVGSTGGIFTGGLTTRVSDDAGLTWSTEQQISTWNSAVFTPQPHVHVHGNTVCVFWEERVTQTAWMQRSTDGGATWPGSDVLIGTVPIPVPSTSGYHIEMDLVGEGDEIHIYFMTTSSAGYEAWLQSSYDAGQTWLSNQRRIGQHQPTGQTRGMSGNGDLLLVGSLGGKLSRSDDDGMTWSPVPGLLMDRIHDVAVHGQTVSIAGTSNGAAPATEFWHIQTSLDGAQTWQSPGLYASAPIGFEVDLQLTGDDAFALFKGSPTAQVLAHSPDRGQTWSEMEDGVDAIQAASKRVVHLRTDSGSTNSPGLHAYVGTGWTPLGGETPGTGSQAPSLQLASLPVLGRTTSFEIANARGGSLGAIGLTWQQPTATAFGGGTLWLASPMDLTAFATSGTPGGTGVGTASVPFSVANVPALAGARLTAQAAVLDVAAQSGLALTPGIECWLR
ncbi:MAG: hypothetical protein AB8H80_04860 [Planctomycetota bacterium]